MTQPGEGLPREASRDGPLLHRDHCVGVRERGEGS